jgi:MioC protein
VGTIHLLFGTESGNAELVADDVAAELERRGYVAKVHSMDDVDVTWLADAGGAIIITSTYGDGELPMTAVALHRALLRDRPDLSGLQFAAFGLGDSTYDTYNNGVEQLGDLLSELGATRVGEIGRHDAAGIDDHCDLGVAWVQELDDQGLVTRLAGEAG